MTVYRKTMADAYREMYPLNEDNMDLMRKAAKGSMQTIKFKDGKLKVDSFTASGIMAVYDKVNPKNKESMEKMINSGTKGQILKLQSLAMKAAGRKEEVEVDEALLKSRQTSQGKAHHDQVYGSSKIKLKDYQAPMVKGKRVGGSSKLFQKSATGYNIYHKTFSGAMQHAYAHAKKKFGITINPNEIDQKVASGPRKPSSGKTNRYGLKGDKGGIQVQVYNTGSDYELNMYKEEVELEEATERDILVALKKERIGGYFSGGKLYVAQRALETVRDILRGMKLTSMPKLVGEELTEGAWQLPVGPKGRAGLKKLLQKPVKAKDAIDAIDPYIGDDELFDDIGELDDKNPNQDARPLIRAAMKRLKIKEDMGVYQDAISKLVGEARQLKDPKKEMMVKSKDTGVIVIDKKDFKKYEKKGYFAVEETEVDEHKGKKPHKHPHPEGGPLATVDEDFTKADFGDNEDKNYHSENAVELAKKFGTKAEIKRMMEIQKAHMARRHITSSDQKERDKLISKYYPKLKEDLDEKVRYSAPTKDGKNTFQVIDRDTKGMRGKQDDYKMVIVDKKGKVVKDWGSHVTVDGAVMFAKNKKIIEDVELDEKVGYALVVQQKDGSREIVAKGSKGAMKSTAKKHGGLKQGKTFLTLTAKEIGDKVLGIGESLEEGKMKELHMYIQQKKSAEWIAKKMSLDVKTVKALMPEETVLERVDRFLESARSDAMKAMRRSGEFSDKDDDDVTASDDDVKAASKNIIAQMRKVVSLRGKFKVEFQNGKKEKIDPKIAQAVQQKYNSMRRPADKEKFQSQISKSKKDLLNALKESLEEAGDRAKEVADKHAKEKRQQTVDKKREDEKGRRDAESAAGKREQEKDTAQATDKRTSDRESAQKKKDAEIEKRKKKEASAKSKREMDAASRERKREQEAEKRQKATEIKPKKTTQQESILSRIDEKIQERKNG